MADPQSTEQRQSGHVVDFEGVPEQFPTHRHPRAFWESLGRAVATFGFLEEILARAIFAFTATRTYTEDEAQKAYDEWLPKLERALIDPLGNLIDAYGKAVREHDSATLDGFDDLLSKLREASKTRNVLCHGSWGSPDDSGASTPFFVNRQKMIFETAVDQRFLDQVQLHVAELACAVIGTVTTLGWQFPGSEGPGKPICR